jgi:hypothetical protein
VEHVRKIEIEGGAYERGRQYGSAVATEILQNSQAYSRLVKYQAWRLRRHSALSSRLLRPTSSWRCVGSLTVQAALLTRCS